MWWVFFALLLGLASAVLGASVVAVSRTQRRALERPRDIPPEVRRCRSTRRLVPSGPGRRTGISSQAIATSAARSLGSALRELVWLSSSHGARPRRSDWPGARSAIRNGALLPGEAPRSAYVSDERVTRQQPVQFSHRHHVGDDGIDCRYCHTTVELPHHRQGFRRPNLPDRHRRISAHSPLLAAVQESARTGLPILWTRVYDLTGLTYTLIIASTSKRASAARPVMGGRADGAHPAKCRPLMSFCLDCHRHPERFLRPCAKSSICSGSPRGIRNEVGRRLLTEYQVADARTLTSCSTCHR